MTKKCTDCQCKCDDFEPKSTTDWGEIVMYVCIATVLIAAIFRNVAF